DCVSVTCFSHLYSQPARPDIYPLSLHDALPISSAVPGQGPVGQPDEVCDRHDVDEHATCDGAAHQAQRPPAGVLHEDPGFTVDRSEEHTSELQSRFDLVCRLLLDKKTHPDSTED